MAWVFVPPAAAAPRPAVGATVLRRALGATPAPGDGRAPDVWTPLGAAAPTPPPSPRPQGRDPLPRLFFSAAIGSGLGFARGRAELSYEMFDPNGTYGPAERACAVARWFGGNHTVAPDVATFQAQLEEIAAAGSDFVPSGGQSLVAAYDPDRCARHQGVARGLASALLHVVPEIGGRVSKRIVLSGFVRMQPITGSQVYGDDPNLPIVPSFNVDVRSPNPPGTRRRHPFTVATGVKVKYFVPSGERKLRLFVGGFAGYGFARLRVPLGVANDRNANSVPDDRESAISGPRSSNGAIDPARCVPVWPYERGCEIGPQGSADRELAGSVQGARSRDERIDTVVLGPGFVGGLVGLHYQVVKHFALFVELDAGAWFPTTSSVLFDLSLGPTLTF